MKWYQKVLNWITFGAIKIAKAIYEIVAPAVKSAALEFVNNPDNQAVAIAAVKAAIARGLKGEKAWTVARDALLDQLGESAWSIADNWLDTLLQSAYFALKNAEE
jgi:hypothetical protein